MIEGQDDKQGEADCRDERERYEAVSQCEVETG